MADELLTEEVAITAIRNFFRYKPFLFFGTGMSCCLDNRFGMFALKDTLTDRIQNRTLTIVQTTEWDAVLLNLQNGMDMENALDSVNDHDLLKMLTEITGSFVADRVCSHNCVNGLNDFTSLLPL
ncbi:MAG: hypothetical protein IH624_17035 [Phycisphaerae bacterium]|nr:hypothetical protein [Phycisphaerae bacterium]